MSSAIRVGLKSHSMRVTADPTAQHVHQGAWLHRAKLAGVEEFAVTDRTGLVPYRPRAPIENPDHWRMTARAVHAPLVVAAGASHRARGSEQVDTRFPAADAIPDRVELQPPDGH